MRKLNLRDLVIFVMVLVLATVLIGLGMALVITLKHRTVPGNSNAPVIKQGRLISDAQA